MKYLFILFFTVTISAVNAQVVKPAKTFKVPLKTPTEKIEIEVDNTDKKVSAKSDKTYYWFKSKEMHSTEGAYSGRLLHGAYIAHYRSNQLKMKGSFKYGLKDGEWVEWEESGKKKETTYWNNGVQKQNEVVKKEAVKTETEKAETDKAETEVIKEEKKTETPSDVKPPKVKKTKKEKVKKEKGKKDKKKEKVKKTDPAIVP